jgi:hypothetical protein
MTAIDTCFPNQNPINSIRLILKNNPMKKTILALALVAGLISFGGTAKAQSYNFTTFNYPNGVIGTYITGISGSTIVGYSYDSNYNASGFTYNGSAFTTLNDPNGVHGTYITGISGSTIVGYSYGSNYKTKAFVASAVPEPSTYALFGIGAIGMLVVMRRKKSA